MNEWIKLKMNEWMNEYSQVHEELNMATKKKYKQLRDTPNRPDEWMD